MSEIRVKSTGTIKLFESDNTSHITIASPASLSANRTITIPDADVNLTNIAVNTAKTGITSSQTSAIIANTAKTTNATHSGEVTGATALTIADNIVDEANLKVSNSPTNGYFLSAQSGNTGGLTWAEAGGGITGADQWRVSGDFDGDVDPITNFERADTDGYGGIGTAMSYASGIFTFPDTGYWLIDFTAMFYHNNESRFNNAICYTTTNNSSYGISNYGSCLLQQTQSDNAYGCASSSFIFDVTNTTTHKCKFASDVSAGGATTAGATGTNQTIATFIRLGDT